MIQEDISKFIKDIRKKNNLTQKNLADKLGVTYQAVSKWENGKNIPDIETLKEISKIFDVNVDEIIGNKTTNKKKKNKFIVFGIILIIILAVILGIIIIQNNSPAFEFKQLNTTCEEFKITGSAAYNKKTSSIYISGVEFCGTNDEVYKKLSCDLYEEYGNTKTKISSYEQKENMNLKEYLKDVKLNVNNYSSVCKDFNTSSLYIEINTTDKNNKITTYKIPITLDNDCK